MNSRSAILNRMFVVFGLVLLVPFAIGMQLFRINFIEGSELRQLWSEQTIDYIRIPAQRGNIYDADGTLLVTNSVTYKVALDPKIPELERSEILQICDTLAKYTSVSARQYLQKIESAPPRSRYVVLNNQVDTEVYDALYQLDFRALILEEEYQRRYNFGSLAAHTLGFLNYEMEGRTGLEKFYDEQLSGEDGVQQVRRERNGQIYAYVGAPRKQPQQGYSLYTTIDSHIQAILEEELEAGIRRTNSKHGTAIVMNPKTGAVLAMANYPTFNPNNLSTLNSENRRNLAVSAMIEPGSTFKLVTAIVAVEQNKVKFNETIETPESGSLLIHGQWMRDHDPLGDLTFPEVIMKSSNIATSKIAMRLSKDTFYQYARNLGFGTPTGIDLPHEETGILPKPYEWSQVTLPWMSIGYEVMVTPIQLTQAYAAFANGGTLMRPYLVEKIVNSEGNIVWKHNDIEVRKVAEKSTIERLYPIFEDVVSDSGTAALAQVEGLAIAGKTGTAQKYIDGQYRSEYRSSFVGFFPADDPKYVCFILLDDPDVYPPYGGWTAGPIFRQTAKRIAGIDDEIEKQIIQSEVEDEAWAHAPNLINLSKQEAEALLSKQHLAYTLKGSGQWVVSQSPEPNTQLKPTDEITLTLSSTLSNTGSVDPPEHHSLIPEVTGMSMRKASFVLNKRGFEVKIIGSGTVQKQFPLAGKIMKEGKPVIIRGSEKSLETIAGI